MTPLEIEIILHYYSHADDYRDGDFSAPAVSKAMDKFLGLEMIEGNRTETDARFRITEKGRVFVEALKRVKVPIQETMWVVPD